MRPLTPGWLGNVLGTTYSQYSGTVESVKGPNTKYAASFWAFARGSLSANGTAIVQTLSGVPPSSAEQKPDLSTPACNFQAQPRPVCGNINAIELLTSQSPDAIFQNLVQTFAPVTIPPGQTQSPNTIQTFTSPQTGNSINVIPPPGQILGITLSGWARFVQDTFYVKTRRVDTINHVISVVTLAGHPLAGWRYWRVYSIGTNDVVIETGGYDSAGPGLKRYAGYYITIGTIKQAWKEYMLYIQTSLNAPQGSNIKTSLGGIALGDLSLRNGPLVNGYWDYSGAFTNYILNNVCQSTAC